MKRAAHAIAAVAIVCALPSRALAFEMNISKLQVVSGPMTLQYLQDQRYTSAQGRAIVATVQSSSGWFTWNASDRITVRLDPALQPTSVFVTVMGETPFWMTAEPVEGDVACSRAAYGTCTPHTPPTNSIAAVYVVQNTGASEIDVLPNPGTGIAPFTDIVITIEFKVNAASGTTTQTAVEIHGTEYGYNGTTLAPPANQTKALDPAQHTIAVQTAQPGTFAIAAAPSTTVRREPATITLSATDQNGDAIQDLSAVVVTLDERLGTAGGPMLALPDRGTLVAGPSNNTRTYTPGANGQTQPIVALFSATHASMTPPPAEVQVLRGNIGAFTLSPQADTVSPGDTRTFVPANAKNDAPSMGNELLAPTDVAYAIASDASVLGATIDQATGTVTARSDVWRDSDETVTITATVNGKQATATLVITKTAITDCTFTLTPATIGLAEASRPLLQALDASGQMRDLNAAYTWTPLDALELRGAELFAKRAGLAVEVTAAASVCPGGGARKQTLTVRTPQAGELEGVALEPSEIPTLVVGAVRTVSAVGLYVGGERRPITPDLWTAGPGLELVDAGGARQASASDRQIRAVAPGTSFVAYSYRGLQATVPVQIDEAYLSLAWSLPKRAFRQGELVAAKLIVTSEATGPHAGVTIGAAIPRGLRATADHWTIDVPAGGFTQTLEVPMLASAMSGRWRLEANAQDPERDAPLLDTPATELVTIVADPEFSEALLVGRVFDDTNKNGRADEGEPGIAGVTIGLTSGIFVTTDKNGNYHVPALIPESCVAKIDVNTLPHHAPLTTKERVPLVLTPGMIFRADFGVDLSEPRPPSLAQDRTKAPRLVTKDGVREYVLPVVFSDGERQEKRLVRVPLADVRNEVTVQASSDNGTAGHYQVVVRRYVSGASEAFVVDPPLLVRTEYPPPPESTHFLVALGEGIIGFEPRENVAQGLKEYNVDGRLAFAYRGRIKGKVLVDAGADTTIRDVPNFFQRDVRRVFRNLDPEAYYPVYGDSSQLVDERESGQKLYVRVEAGPVMAKYGAFRSGLSQNQFGRYDRAMVGVAGRFLVDRQSDAHKIFVFYAKPESQRVHDELYVTGSSLYYLSQQSVVEGSEQIWLETRQQRTGLQRERRLLVPGTDYQIDYIAGRVLLESTLSPAAPSTSVLRQGTGDGDERWLQVDYEVSANLASAQAHVVGGRVSERPVQGVELGVTGVAELRAGNDRYWLVGGDVTLNVWKPLTLHAEYAHSEGALQARALSYDGGLAFTALPNSGEPYGEPKGDAFLARVGFDYAGWKAEAYGKYRSLGFNDTTSAAGERASQFGGTARTPDFHGFSAALSIDDLRREATFSTLGITALPAGGVRLGRQASELELQQNIGPVTLLAAARYAQVAPGFGAGKEVVIGGGLVWRIIPRLAIGVMHQQPVYRVGDRVFDTLVRDTQLLARFVIWRGIEGEAAIGYGERGINGRATAIVPLSQDTKLTAGMIYGGATVSEGLSVGLRRRTAEGTLMYVDNQFQRTNLLGGAQINAQNSQQQPSIETHTGGVETRLFGAHMLSVAGEAGKRNPGGGFDALVERYGAGVGHAYLGERLTIRSRLEARFDAVTAASPTSADSIRAAPNQRTLAGFVRADIRATDTLSIAAWFKGNASVALTAGDPPLAEMAEAAAGFAYRPDAALKPTLFGRYAFTHDRLPRAQNPANAVTDAHIASLAFTFDPWRYIGLYGKVAGKIGTLRVAGNDPMDLASVLAIPRVNGHVTSFLDVSVEYRMCYDKYAGPKHGVLGEVSVLVGDYVRLGGGYNHSDIGENSVDCNAQGIRGFFIRAQAMY